MSGTDGQLQEDANTTESAEQNTGEYNVADVVCRDPENLAMPCSICDGRGVYAFDVPLTDPRFGKFQRCPNYPIAEDHELQKRLRRYGNLEAFRNKTFSNFETELSVSSYTRNVSASLAEAKGKAMSYAEKPHGWIVYEGQVGCGKTHLAVAIANVRLQSFGEQVIFITAPDLLDFLRSSFGAREESSYEDYFERVRKVSLLVLDDLGVENPSAWAKEKMFQLLNFRHINELHTVITTNTPLNEMDPWLSSRLIDNSVVRLIKINAPDYRRTSRSQTEGKLATNLQLYNHMWFHTFKTESNVAREAETLRRAKETARQWALSPSGWLCLMGDYGSGKTHLAASIANELNERGKDLVFYTVPSLLNYLRPASSDRSNRLFEKRFNDVLNAPVLILDDMRLLSTSEWADETLFEILEYRYLSRAPTVITTSETKKSIEEEIPRLATRLFDWRNCQWFDFGSMRSFVYRVEKPN